MEHIKISKLPESQEALKQEQMLVEAWMKVADEHLDSFVSFRRDYDGDQVGGIETWRLHDVVVSMRDEEGNRTSKVPIAVLRQHDGSKRGYTSMEVPIKDLLKWQLNAEGVESEIMTKAVASLGETALSDSVAIEVDDEKIIDDRLQAVLEREITPREKHIFAPLKEADVDKVHTQDFSGLLDATEDVTPDKPLTKKEPKSVRSELTPRTLAESLKNLKLVIERDEVVAGIFENFRAAKDIDTDEGVIKALRQDEGLRVQLGRYFIYKTTDPDVYPQMPERIHYNTQKNPDSTGYRHLRNYMNSREYAALLAISMLDGSFDRSIEDEITYTRTGAVGTGQHRAAARLLLGSHSSLAKADRQ